MNKRRTMDYYLIKMRISFKMGDYKWPLYGINSREHR